MRYLMLIFFVVAIMSLLDIVPAQAVDHSSELTTVPGNINFVAFFEITLPYTANPCTQVDTQFGYMQLTALMFALDIVNRDQSLLFGHKLGMQVYDLCKERKTKLLKPLLAHTLGAIGPKYSDDAKFVSQVFQAAKLPVISYDATSIVLSDSTEYPNFYRTVSSDLSLAEAMIQLASMLKWKYISVLYSYGSYGNSLATLFVQRASEIGVCVPVFRFISQTPDVIQINTIVQDIMENEKVNVVFCLLHDKHIPKLLRAFRDWKGRNRNLTFVGGDGWGAKLDLINGVESVAKGALTFSFFPSPMQEFENYVQSLNPLHNYTFPLLDKFWEQTFQCSLVPSGLGNQCTGHEQLFNKNGFSQNTPILPVINAVFAQAYMARAAIIKHCGKQNNMTCLKSSKEVRKLIKKTWEELAELDLAGLMSKIKFNNPFIYDELSFNSLHTIPSGYALYNLKEEHGEYMYELVGSWQPPSSRLMSSRNGPQLQHGSLQLDFESIRWASGDNIPASVCSNPCNRDAGEVHVYADQSHCCWRCKRCGNNDLIVNEKCTSCGFGYYPNKNRTVCVKVQAAPSIIDSALASVIISITVLGCLCSCCFGLMFILHRNTKEVKAMSRELSAVMLMGILFTYITPIFFLLEPTRVSCGVRRFNCALGIVLTYAPLFLRTLRIYRVFKVSKQMSRRLHALSPSFQILLSIALVGVQLLISSVWLMSEISQVQIFVIEVKKLSFTQCKVQVTTTILQFLFPLFLILLCCFYGYKIRHIPKMYNESKSVAFTLYMSILIVAIIVPVLLLIPVTENHHRSYIVCFTYQSLATTALCGLFGIKLKKLPRKIGTAEFASSDILSRENNAKMSMEMIMNLAK